MAASGAASKGVKHPYLPATLVLEAYTPNDLTYPYIVGVFFSVVGVVLAVAWIVSGRKSKWTLLDRLTFLWCVACFGIHLFLEGYFALNNRTIATDMSFLGQVWKEYSFGDSRYITSDGFTVIMESFTAFVEGPAAGLTALAMLFNSPWRFPLQFFFSFGELYGCILYFGIAWWDNFAFCSPEPLHFWFYFFFMNILWIVIPALLCWQSVSHTVQAFRVAAAAGAAAGKKTK